MPLHGEILEAERKAGNRNELPPSGRSRAKIAYAIYGICLGLAIGIWFLAVRTPLWLDETGSYWQISAGFSQIWPRQYICLAFPAYSYILWFGSQLLGVSEVALRVPSILAMLGAVYLIYLCARELFGREMGLVAAIIFSANPIVIFESIDARPYAFVALATNAAIYVLLKLRKSDSVLLAGIFGLFCALILYFHFLGAVVLPALLLGFVLLKPGQGKAFWWQFWTALIVFAGAFLPLLPGLEHLFRTGRTHVFETAPSWAVLITPFASGLLPFAFAAAVLVAVLTIRRDEKSNFRKWQVLLCLSLALIPIFILFGVSEWTPIRLFASRHQLVAVPGIALCWALALSPFRSRPVWLTFCVVLMGITAGLLFTSPSSGQHGYTWKYALAAAEKNASADHVPVLICSDWPESNFVAMYSGIVKQSVFFAPLSYYRLTVPVIPLPRALNSEAKDVGAAFIARAKLKHERFLAMAWYPSYETLQWLERRAAGAYNVKVLGVYDGVKVLDFVPLKG